MILEWPLLLFLQSPTSSLPYEPSLLSSSHNILLAFQSRKYFLYLLLHSYLPCFGYLFFYFVTFNLHCFLHPLGSYIALLAIFCLLYTCWPIILITFTLSWKASIFHRWCLLQLLLVFSNDCNLLDQYHRVPYPHHHHKQTSNLISSCNSYRGM